MSPYALGSPVVTVRGMSDPSDQTDVQWDLLEPVFNAPGKRGRKHADDLPILVNPLLFYIAQIGCQWRYLPERSDPGSGLVAVPPLVPQWHLGTGPHGAARGRSAEIIGR